MKKIRIFWRTMKELILANRKVVVQYVIFILSLAICLTFNLDNALLNELPTEENVQKCESILSEYLTSPASFKLEDGYQICLENDSVRLTHEWTTCIAEPMIDGTYAITSIVNNISYTVTHILSTIIMWIICYVLLHAICKILKFLFQKIKEFREKYYIQRTAVIKGMSLEEAEEHMLECMIEEAYQKANDIGYTDGRAEGFKQGEQDLYDEGFLAGYERAVEDINTQSEYECYEIDDEDDEIEQENLDD